MKRIISLPRIAALLAIVSCVSPSLAQPPPGGPYGPGYPGGPVPPHHRRGPIVPIIPIPPPYPHYGHGHRAHSDSDSTTAQVQRKLKTLGYYDSSVDGAIGPKTRAAIRAYQEENKLEITGQIDKELLTSLGL